jgi:Ca-activated chloride channel family protein
VSHVRARTTRRAAALLAALALGLAACSGTPQPAPTTAGTSAAPPKPGVLRVLASSELQDMTGVLEQAKKATGVSVQLTYTGSLDGADTVSSGKADGTYDAVWFSSDHYLGLDPAGRAKLVSETPVMVSPVAVGVRTDLLAGLGWGDGSQVTWSQIGQAAASGRLAYGMTDPSRSNSGFATLVAVASAFSGAAAALTDADVAKATPQLREFFAGQKLTAGSSGWLAQAYQQAGGNGKIGALVNYESVLLSLDRTLPQPDRLTVIRPVDGVVSADYPLALLASAGQPARDAFRRLTGYLLGTDAQRAVTEQTLRRPVTPGVAPAAGLPTDRRRELPFPGTRAVADGLLSAYQNQLRRPSRTVYVLDTSGSMAGTRLAQLKAALGRLTGTDDTRGQRRFRDREEVTLIPFASQVKAEKTHTVPESDPQTELAAIDADVQALTADGGTALYTSIEDAYRVIARQQAAEHDDRFTSIVVMTDGESNEGATDADFRTFVQALPPGQSVPVFPILFGDAAKSQLQSVADLTGGKLFDGTGSLDGAFEEIRGYQ